jgi:putative ABC transport system substrate-binding protein
MLLTGPPATATPEYAAFMKQLGDLGWIEGQNLAVDRRWADAPEKFIGLATDVVQSKPAVILAAGPDATRAAQRATSAIPIVMIASSDPRVLGAASLAHPGGNLTGLTIGQPEVTSEKRLQLLKEARPALARVAVLWDVKRSADGGASVGDDGRRQSVGLAAPARQREARAISPRPLPQRRAPMPRRSCS